MQFEKERHYMVERQLRARGIRDNKVLEAMERVQRHLFVSDDMKDRAYEDCALSIGEGQTISQPFMVALMIELLELKGTEKVLEIGTGSGYQSALLAGLASDVFTLERIPALAARAQALLMELGCSNIQLLVSDGTLGLPEHAPYDAIIVSAGAPHIPEQYIEQLNTGGRLVIPVGSRYSQTLYRILKTADGIYKSVSTACVFVPLVGRNGWDEKEFD